MKILHACARFPPSIGGTEQAVLGMCQGLQQIGHEVKVVCAREPGDGHGPYAGISVRRLNSWGNLSNSPIVPGLAGFIRRETFDILHTHLPHPWVADISGFMARRKRCPLFLTYHNDIIGQGKYHPAAELYNFLFLPFLLNQTRKIFIGQKNYLDRSTLLQKWSSKVVVAPFGVDTTFFKPVPVAKEPLFTLFFLSILDEFHQYKGLDVLLQALSKLGRTDKIRLLVGGSGTLLPRYQVLAQSLNLSACVTFLGGLSRQEVLHSYNQCDIFVLPSTSSLREGFGLVAQEAMACGKPVIISDIVGVAPDVLQANAGIAIAPDNVEQLAGAIQTCFQDQDETTRMGQRALHLVSKKYSGETHARILEKEYLNI